MEFLKVLVRYEITLWNALDRRLADRGLTTLGQLHALRAVDRHDGRARVQELSGEIGITVGAASKLVDRLERDGLVVRQPNPSNRRSSWIDLTPAGRRAVGEGTDFSRDALAELLGDEDVEPLIAGLRRLQVRLDEQTLPVTA